MGLRSPYISRFCVLLFVCFFVFNGNADSVFAAFRILQWLLFSETIGHQAGCGVLEVNILTVIFPRVLKILYITAITYKYALLQESS